MHVEPLTTKEYWQDQSVPFKPFGVNDNPFADLLQRYLPFNPEFSCVEIGAYPGGYLCYLAKKFGYRATAIEYRSDAGDIARLFSFNGLTAPNIINADFFEIDAPQFDVVCSFGFAEHFNDLRKVVEQHMKLTRPGGYVVLTVPHVRGYQWLVRRLVYTKEAFSELKATHNLTVMRLKVVRRALQEAGLKVQHANYAMGAHLWVRPDSPRVKSSAKWLVEQLTKIDSHVGLKLPPNVIYSPMIFTLSRKPMA